MQFLFDFLLGFQVDRDVVSSSCTPGSLRGPVPSRPLLLACKPGCGGSSAPYFVECLAKNQDDVVESSVAFLGRQILTDAKISPSGDPLKH